MTDVHNPSMGTEHSGLKPKGSLHFKSVIRQLADDGKG